MQQIQDPRYTRGRAGALAVNFKTQTILYVAPNRMRFFIDTTPLNEGGQPIVNCCVDTWHPQSRSVPSLNSMPACLGNLRGFNLAKVLFACDTWAQCYGYYRMTGIFPNNLVDVFWFLSCRKAVRRGLRHHFTEKTSWTTSCNKSKTQHTPVDEPPRWQSTSKLKLSCM